MRNLFSKIVFMGCLLAMGLPAMGATKKVVIDNIVYSVNTTDKRAQVKGRNEEATKNWKLNVPDEILTDWGTIKVTSVASQAFLYDSYLVSVSLSNHTETVGSEAFFGCSKLKTVNLGTSVKILGQSSFSNTAITSITLPASLEIIRDQVFAAAKSLSYVEFDRSTTKLESIGFGAFWLTALQNVVIPGCVKTIGKEAFSSCSQLTSVTFLAGNGKTAIGEDCFTNLRNLTKVSFGNPGVESIGNGAFTFCNLNEVVFPSTLRTIGNWAFSDNRLYKIVFNEGLLTIGHGAFSDQNSTVPGMISLDRLTSLELPSTLTSIGEKAFFDVSEHLINVTSKATVPPTALELAFNAAVQLHGVLWVPASSVAAYGAANIWKDFQDIRAIGSAAVTAIEDDGCEPAAEYFNLKGERVNAESLSPGVYLKRVRGKVRKVVI